MKWEKLGRIYEPKPQSCWATSYAHLPTAYKFADSRIKIFFATLDKNRIGRISCIELDSANPKKILFEAEKPVLEPGQSGLFDEHGVNPSCLIKIADQYFLYYIGWQRGVTIPYFLFAGLAVSDDGENFKKLKHVPILERNHMEPYIRSAMTVIYDQGTFKAWYPSASNWVTLGSKMYPKYEIRYAESRNGIDWKAFNEVSIRLEDQCEFGLGRPHVMKLKDKYLMWYSIRSYHPDSEFAEDYRIGMAESLDGATWKRIDQNVGICKSEKGWDSQMICYPNIIENAGKWLMFYNGNNHGETGFGLAIKDAE